MTAYNRNLVDELNRALPAGSHANLGTLLAAMQDDIAMLGATERLMSTATLIKNASTSKTAFASTAFTAIASGVVQTKAANTSMATIAGTLANNKFALWAFYIDKDGSLTSSTKTADAASAAAALKLKPAVPSGKVEIGYIIVANASGGDFTGNTTNLDASGVTTTYVSNEPSTPASAAVALALN